MMVLWLNSQIFADVPTVALTVNGFFPLVKVTVLRASTDIFRFKRPKRLTKFAIITSQFDVWTVTAA